MRERAPWSWSARSAARWKKKRPRSLPAIDKPVVSFIAGRASPPGKKMGHAGAIVMGDRGSYKSKRSTLEKAGVEVVDTPSEIAWVLQKATVA